MIIGIEASRANRLHKTGVEWYSWQLIQALKRLPETAAHSWLLYTHAPLTADLRTGPENWHEGRLNWPLPYLWTQGRLSWEMFRHPPQELFIPAHVLPLIAPKKSVVTIHDIGFHRFPRLYKPIQLAYHEWSTRDILSRASRLITVSNFSKQELIDAYRAEPERIQVIPPGIDADRYRPLTRDVTDPVLQARRIVRPFLLCIGRIERKKNIATLLQAFEQFKRTRGSGDPFQLILLGPPGAGYATFQKTIARSTYKDSIHVLGYVSEAEKIALLSSAYALIHPTWYEGFGLTPLEAMACGTPVVAAHVAALPEILGEDNAVWFDPQDPAGLAQAMLQAVDDLFIRETLIPNGMEWIKRYTWEATARATLGVLEKE